MDGEKKKLRLSFGYLILGLWAVLLVQQVLSAYLRPNRISYTDFKAAVAQGKVEEVAIGKTADSGTHEGRRRGAGSALDRRATQTPSATAAAGHTGAAAGDKERGRRRGQDGLRNRARRRSRSAEGSRRARRARDRRRGVHVLARRAGWLIPIALIGVFWMLMIRRIGQAGQNGFMTLGRSKAKVYMEKDVNVRFTDVPASTRRRRSCAR